MDNNGSRPRRQQRVPLATEVLDGIYIGNHRSASSRSFLATTGTAGVVNCTANIPNHFAFDESLQYLRVPVHDNLANRDVNKLLTYFPVACEFIHKVRVIEGKPVLVHCQAGKQRSAAVVAAFLIKHHGYKPYDAVQFLLRKKPNVFHNGRSVNFAVALNRWFHCLQLPMTDTRT